MAFNASDFTVSSRAYNLPLQYYKDYIAMQSKAKDYEQTLHRKSNYLTMTASQKKAVAHVTQELDSGKQVSFFITGEAGCGKSFIAAAICDHVKQKGGQYICCAPTGSAASQLFSMTFYSLLGFTFPKASFEKLVDVAIPPYVKNRLKGVTTLIIDECSMVGAKGLACISQRLGRILGNTLPYGGLHTVMLADMTQIFPVGDVALTKNPELVTDAMALEGLELYSNCSKIEITGNYRAKEDEPFSKVLLNIRNRKVTVEDIKLLEERVQTNMEKEDVDRFENALHIFGDNRSVSMHNSFHAMKHKAPTKYLESQIVPHCAECKEDYDGVFAGVNLEYVITKNIATKLNVVNGTRVKIVDFVYKKSTDATPDFLVVEFVKGEFRGRPLHDKPNQIPIFPVVDRFTCPHTKQNTKVVQWPIKLGYGMTIHKCQGQTLPLAVVSLNGLQPSDRRLYVGLSRVSCLKNLMIKAESVSQASSFDLGELLLDHQNC